MVKSNTLFKGMNCEFVPSKRKVRTVIVNMTNLTLINMHVGPKFQMLNTEIRKLNPLKI